MTSVGARGLGRLVGDLAERDESPLERWLRAPLWAASAPYALGARLHRSAWESRWFAPERLPCAVVAVGSPLVGGTGKTPLVAWLAGALRRRGRRVAVASRGHGRRSRGLVVVSDGARIRANVSEAGDEPMWLAARLPGVPVLVAANRVAAGRYASATLGVDTLVLDDGLQHHQLQRDVAIATLDGATGLGNGFVLPRGPLREPLGALDRADVLAVWRDECELPPGDERRIEDAAPGLRRLGLRRRAAAVRLLGGDIEYPPASLQGLGVGVLSALANPARLRRSVESLGARVIAERRFGDHHRYRARDLRGLARQAPIWITSEKDAVKLEADWMCGLDVRVLSSEVLVDEPGAFLDWLDGALELRRPAAS
jgi:tetraacyldisaccharide 4'-kinase